MKIKARSNDLALVFFIYLSKLYKINHDGKVESGSNEPILLAALLEK